MPEEGAECLEKGVSANGVTCGLAQRLAQKKEPYSFPKTISCTKVDSNGKCIVPEDGAECLSNGISANGVTCGVPHVLA